MIAEKLSDFFDAQGFAVTATVDGVAMPVIFDDAYAQGNVGQVGMASSQPAILLPTPDVPADPVGKAVALGAADYTIAAHEPDGTGISRLLLEVAA